MPIYSYQCKDCNHEFDLLLLDKDEQSSCPSCGSKKLDKLITASNVGKSKEVSVSSPCHTCDKYCKHRSS